MARSSLGTAGLFALVLTSGPSGCGRISFEPVAIPDVLIDSIDPLTPFGTPVPLTDLNSAVGDDDVSLTNDMLEIFFMSARSGSDRAYRATRLTPTDAWSMPIVMPELDAGGDINNLSVTPDGLTVYFASTRVPNAGLVDLWTARRLDRGSSFAPPTRVDELATPVGEYQSYVGASGLWMYYGCDDVDGGDLWVARRGSVTDPFAPGAAIPSLNSSTYEGGAWVDASERLAVFHRISGSVEDLFVATRPDTTAAWTVAKVTELSLPAFADQDPWLSPDLRTIMFVSDRAGSDDLYTATR